MVWNKADEEWTSYTGIKNAPSVQAAPGKGAVAFWYTDDGNGADFTGTEQTIQPDPVKPEYTEDELKDPTKTPDGTPVEGTPEPQDHNNVTPPPEQPSTNTSGGLPGFDNVPNAGANQGGSIDSDGDINTQVGIMG